MRMMHRETPGGIDPGTIIVDPAVKELYCRFLDTICGFHDDVTVKTSQMEARAYFGDAFLCRVVAYRQLFHVVIGKEIVWETRVRDSDGWVEAVDRVLSRFLDICARRSSGPA